MATESSQAPDAAIPRETEHKATRTSGWTWSEEHADYLPFEGLRIEWRFVGDRIWRKVTVVPHGDQTVESLRKDVPKMVERLAERA